jgi:hypothetical protein
VRAREPLTDAELDALNDAPTAAANEWFCLDVGLDRNDSCNGSMPGFRVTNHEATTVIATCNACSWRSSERHLPKVAQQAREHAQHEGGHIVTAVYTLVRIFKRVGSHGERDQAWPSPTTVEP